MKHELIGRASPQSEKVSFSGYTSCRGIDPETYLIDHAEHTGWDLEDFNNPLSPQPFYWSTPY